MSLFNEKVKLNKVLWKELVIGILEGFLWCTVLFLIVYGYNEEMIDLLNFMSDNVDKVWALYFSLLAIFVVISVLIKLGFFIVKSEVTSKPARRVKRAETPKVTAVKKTTAKKKTTKK